MTPATIGDAIEVPEKRAKGYVLLLKEIDENCVNELSVNEEIEETIFTPGAAISGFNTSS
jgi:hypothetical protein